MHIDIAYIAQKDLEVRYKKKNAPKTYQIKYKLSRIYQNSDSVTEYFKKNLKPFGISLMIILCTDCMPIYEKKQLDKVHAFLFVLNEQFVTIRGQILSLDHEMPSTNKVFSLIVQDNIREISLIK